jgi:GT2 family glycosyltransferase
VITYVIATYGGAETLPKTINAIQDQTIDGEIIVTVDDAGVDNTPELLREEYPDVNAILLDKNAGHAAALNNGLEQSDSEFVALLDDDINLPKDWAETLLNEFEERDDDIALIQPNIVEEDYERADYSEIVTFQGCGVLARREPLKKIGFFDEEYFVYRDDYQVSAELLNAGYRMVGVSSTTTYHDATHNEEGLPFLKAYYETRNEIWNRVRYHSRIKAVLSLPKWSAVRIYKAQKSGTVTDVVKGLIDGASRLDNWTSKHSRCPKYERRL